MMLRLLLVRIGESPVGKVAETNQTEKTGGSLFTTENGSVLNDR